MKLSLKWINELLDLGNISDQKLNYISQRLIDGGFEVEEIYETSKGIVLDISAPANLTEYLSVYGMLIKLSVLLNKPYKASLSKLTLAVSEENQQSLKYLKQENKTLINKDIKALGITVIENIKNFKTPDWLKNRLKMTNIDVTETILDYQNYILLETGYPFEFYDLEKIRSHVHSKKFTFTLEKIGKKNHKLKASDNKFYKLDESTLVVKANESIIGLAGIIPAKIVKCTKDTTSILIEASVFTASSIRKQSRLTGCKTERSIRYQREIQTHELKNAYDRLIQLLLSNNNNNVKVSNYLKIQQIIKSQFIIKLTYNKFIETVNELYSENYPLKDHLEPSLISEYLTILKYDYAYHLKKAYWLIKIPEHLQNQITRSIHLIEEISRVHGFNKFPAMLPTIQSSGINDKTYNVKRIISSYLLDLGLNEFINYSITINKNIYIDKFSIVNPFNKEQNRLQGLLIFNIIQSIRENLKNGNNRILGFEFSHTFSLLSDFPITTEKESISGVFDPKKIFNNLESKDQMESWRNAKGKFQKLFKQLSIKTFWSNKNIQQYSTILNPKMMAILRTERGEFLGMIGQLHPFYFESFPEYKNLFVFEFNLDRIISQSNRVKLLTSYEYSIYPTITVNLSFENSSILNCNNLKKLIMINGTKILKNVETHNIISNQGLVKKRYSYIFKLTFQSNKTTLSKDKTFLILQSIEKKINMYIKNK